MQARELQVLIEAGSWTVVSIGGGMGLGQKQSIKREKNEHMKTGFEEETFRKLSSLAFHSIACSPLLCLWANP